MRVGVAAWLVVYSLALGADFRTGVWRGREVVYKVIDGTAVAQGDILLDNVDAEPVAADSKGQRGAIRRNGSRYLWPGGVIPYVIDDDVPEQNRITEAIEHWHNSTNIRLIRRTNEADYIRFRKHNTSCSSFVGRVGREQAVNLADSCSRGSVIHEIGHVVGLFHEQSRTDRDFYLQVLDKNVDKRELINFAQSLTTGEDFEAYDFASIMHYRPTAFSRNGRPVLATVPAGVPIGQNERLSPADIGAVRSMYGAETGETVITSFPFGLELEVDGQRVQTPHVVRWQAGSVHTISASGAQVSDNVRYVFGRWSDGGDATHTVVASPDTTIYTASFIRQHRLPLRSVPATAGRVEVTPSPVDNEWFPEGVELQIRPIPNDGWNFVGWTGFGGFGTHGVSPNPLNVIVHERIEYTANFNRSSTTRITSQPEGLKLVVDGETITTPRAFVWTPGSSHTINVAETEQKTGNETARHRFEGWSDDGFTSHTITAGTESQTFTARFRTQFLVTRENSSGGRVEITPQTDGEYYDAGATLTLRPAASNGSRFLNWTGDITGADDPASLLVDDQKVVSAEFGTPRQISSGGIVNGASFLDAGVSPGQIVTIFGTDIGPEEIAGAQISGGRLTTSLAGYRVFFDDTPAPLIYAARNQIAAIAPYALANRPDTVVRIAGPGWTSGVRGVPVVESAPAIFTANSSGKGPAAALNQDGSLNTAENPAPRGSVVVLYATGEGQVTASVPDGSVVSNLYGPRQPVQVRVGSRPAKLLYAGSAPGMVAGVMQLNVEIPGDSASGVLPVSVRVGSVSSPGNVSVFVGR